MPLIKLDPMICHCIWFIFWFFVRFATYIPTFETAFRMIRSCSSRFYPWIKKKLLIWCRVWIKYRINSYLHMGYVIFIKSYHSIDMKSSETMKNTFNDLGFYFCKIVFIERHLTNPTENIAHWTWRLFEVLKFNHLQRVTSFYFNNRKSHFKCYPVAHLLLDSPKENFSVIQSTTYQPSAITKNNWEIKFNCRIKRINIVKISIGNFNLALKFSS